MKFLCLPGAYGSCEKFKVQLAPIVTELTADGSAEFHFIDAPCAAMPPAGFEEYFGQPPYYRFIEPDDKDANENADDVLARIRDFPECETPEDTMRELMKVGVADSRKSSNAAVKFVFKIMEEEGPFDGIIGYSEGAVVASTVLLTEQLLLEDHGREPMLKCAIFFAGWPPLDPRSYGLVLSDETTWSIDLPTVHIIGSLDPYLDGSMALYNVCDPDKAYIFDHAKGHTLPREKTLVKELGDAVRRMIAEARE